jgi:hypothetical protein
MSHDSHEEHGHDSHAKENHDQDKETKKNHEKQFPVSFEVLVLLAIAARIVLKSVPFLNIPSLEPIIPLAVLAGYFFGTGQGAILGVFGYVFSNFFIELKYGFGLWNMPQALGGAFAGYLGSRTTPSNYIFTVVWATIAYEFIINFWSANFTLDFGYFGASLPFGLVHVVGNIFFAWVLATFYLKE